MRPPIQETSTTMKLKLIINKETKQLVFAEADKDFVDFLFSIPQLPLGNLLSLLHKSDGDDHPLVSKGCLGNLYNTIKYFDESYIVTDMRSFCCVPNRSRPVEDVKKTLLKPMTVDTVKINGLDNVRTTKYIVMDDLTVKPMSLISSINCLEKLGVCVSDANKHLEEKDVVVGKHEVMRLLKELPMTKSVLTNVFLANGESSVDASGKSKHEDYVMLDQVPTFIRELRSTSTPLFTSSLASSSSTTPSTFGSFPCVTLTPSRFSSPSSTTLSRFSSPSSTTPSLFFGPSYSSTTSPFAQVVPIISAPFGGHVQAPVWPTWSSRR